jgi:hypothetical protein
MMTRERVASTPTAPLKYPTYYGFDVCVTNRFPVLTASRFAQPLHSLHSLPVSSSVSSPSQLVAHILKLKFGFIWDLKGVA